MIRGRRRAAFFEGAPKAVVVASVFRERGSFKAKILPRGRTIHAVLLELRSWQSGKLFSEAKL